MSFKHRIEKIRPYLPSRKLSLFLGSAALLVGLFFAGTAIDFSKLATLFTRNSSNNITLGALVDRDSDEDGIKDWEEGLWGTDPFKKDTDGDGIPDGAFIAEKKKALNGDTTLYATETGFPDPALSIGAGNTTEAFAKELFTAVIALQQSGNLNDASMNALLESFAYNVENLKQKKIYTRDDLITVSSSEGNTVAYVIALDPAFEKTPWKNDRTIETLAIALESENEEALSEIATTRGAYELFRDTLIKAPTPEDAIIVQLAVLNPVQGIIENMQAMERSYEDPIPAIASVHAYLNNFELLSKNLAGVSAYIGSFIE